MVSFQTDSGPWDVEVDTWRGVTGFYRGKACATLLKFTNGRTANSPNVEKSNDSTCSKQRAFLRPSSETCAWVHQALNLIPPVGMETHHSVLLTTPPSPVSGVTVRKEASPQWGEGVILMRKLGIFCFRDKLKLL